MAYTQFYATVLGGKYLNSLLPHVCMYVCSSLLHQSEFKLLMSTVSRNVAHSRLRTPLNFLVI